MKEIIDKVAILFKYKATTFRNEFYKGSFK